MADTIRTYAQLATLLADNTTGAISPQDLRDFMESMRVYGQIYTEGGSTAQTGIGTSYAKMTGFAADGAAKGMTPAFASNKITVGTNGAGVYLAYFTASFTGSNSTVFDIQLRVGASHDAGSGILGREMTGTATEGSASFAGVVTLADAEEVELYIKADGASKSLTPIEMSLILLRIG